MLLYFYVPHQVFWEAPETVNSVVRGFEDAPARPYNNEGEDTMISQAIKGWLQKLFAWWPWKSMPENDYVHPASPINKSIVPDATMYTTVDGTVSQPGSSSVAVEHSDDEEMFTELAWTMPDPNSDERPEPFMPPPPVTEEQRDIPSTSSMEQNKLPSTTGELATISTPTPTPAQKLEFLRYLVQRGLVNEGFDRGYEPEQYRKNR